MPGHSPRIALYGHDTLGLGHVRRNLALADAFAEMDPRPATLILSGAPEAGRFPLPEGAEIVTVPSVRKDADGHYDGRRLPLGLAGVVAIRRGILAAALEEFAPDLLIVDKLPLGLEGELDIALRQLRAAGRTRIVLGLRDVLDEPAVARAEWRDGRMTETVRELYDEIWVYGDPSVHDVIAACGVPPSLHPLVRYTGYLARGRHTPDGPPTGHHTVGSRPVSSPYVLATVGGGQDGFALAAAFAAAPMPAGTTGVLLTGPQMSSADRDAVAAIAADRTDLQVHAFSPDVTAWIASADAVVTMGGANTLAEILATDVPALVVPREQPRAEQIVRARALAARGLVDWLPAAAADASAIGRWILATCDGHGRRADRSSVALDGLARATELAAAALTDRDGFDVAA